MHNEIRTYICILLHEIMCRISLQSDRGRGIKHHAVQSRYRDHLTRSLYSKTEGKVRLLQVGFAVLWNTGSSYNGTWFHRPTFIARYAYCTPLMAFYWSLCVLETHRNCGAHVGTFHEPTHYSDVIMSAMAFQITGVTIVYSTVYSGPDHRKHQSSASLVFVRGIHRSPVNSPHKGPVTRKMFPFDDVIMAAEIGFRLQLG